MDKKEGGGGSAADKIRYCVVLGCKNTGNDLNIWKRTPCAAHNHVFHSNCGCTAPFGLFPFPKSDKLKNLWLYRIGLPKLEVNYSTTICSIHFVEGRPTSRSFFPTLYLQLEDEDELIDGEESGEDDDLDEQEDLLDLTQEEEMRVIESKYHLEESEQVQLFPNSSINANEEDSVRLDENLGDAQRDSLEQELDLDFEQSRQNFPSLLGKSSTPKSPTCSAQEVDDNDEIKFLFQSPSTTIPLAQYDANAQTLQISNPVKYIQECHERIAALISEKEKLKTIYDNNVKRLTAQNDVLKRKLLIATQQSTITTNGYSARTLVRPTLAKGRNGQNSKRGSSRQTSIRFS